MDLSTIGTVIGAALMIGSPAYMLWWRWQVARHWTIVEGVVVRAEALDGTTGKKGIAYPVIQARLPNGETVRFKSKFGSDPCPWKEGDTVRVRVRGDTVAHDAPGQALWLYGGYFAVGFTMVMYARHGVVPSRFSHRL